MAMTSSVFGRSGDRASERDQGVKKSPFSECCEGLVEAEDQTSVLPTHREPR